MQIVIDSEKQIEEGTLVLTFDLLCSRYNEGKPEKMQYGPQGMSKTLRSMGFSSKRNSEGNKRGIFFDVVLIERLKKIYGLEGGVHPLQGFEVSEATVSNPDQTDTNHTQTDTKSENLGDEEIGTIFGATYI